MGISGLSTIGAGGWGARRRIPSFVDQHEGARRTWFGAAVYRLSAQGRKELHQWLRSDPVLHHERHPFLIQLILLGDLEDSPQTFRYSCELEALLRSRLKVMEHLQEKWRRHDRHYPEVVATRDFHAQMTLAFGLARARASLQCSERNIARVKRRMQAPPVPGGKHGRKESNVWNMARQMGPRNGREFRHRKRYRGRAGVIRRAPGADRSPAGLLARTGPEIRDPAWGLGKGVPG